MLPRLMPMVLRARDKACGGLVGPCWRKVPGQFSKAKSAADVLSMTARLALPQITLVAIDTRAPALAAAALMRSMQQADFARVCLFAGAGQVGDLPDLAADIEGIAIPTITSGADYSRFVVRDLPAHISTPFVLVTQWDGFVIDASAWRAEFLQHDYIGAVWPDQPEGLNVGNGGFSLRSQRFMRAACAVDAQQWHPEDEVLCRTHRAWLEREHGVRFAPAALAREFAFENEAMPARAFGFHGPYHLPRVLDEATLRAALASLPDDFFRSRDARRLARALLARGMSKAAAELVARRRAAGRNDPNTRLLGVVASVMQRVAPSRTRG